MRLTSFPKKRGGKFAMLVGVVKLNISDCYRWLNIYICCTRGKVAPDVDQNSDQWTGQCRPHYADFRGLFKWNINWSFLKCSTMQLVQFYDRGNNSWIRLDSFLMYSNAWKAAFSNIPHVGQTQKSHGHITNNDICWRVTMEVIRRSLSYTNV